MSSDIRSQFLLDSEIHYLNHGSFGACPRPVFDEYQRWQLQLERNPIDYFTRQLKGLFSKETAGPLEAARRGLSAFVNGDSQGLIFTPNVTVALNAIAHSLALSEGDEVLTTDHEYGTIRETWKRKCEASKAIFSEVKISLPVGTQSDFVDQFWSSVTPRTRIILMSHITSATALVLPVMEICKRARERGIITVIDGAHAVGQIPLDMEAIGADFYTSNCHKWLLTPKGTGFLYVREDQREALEPMVISWAEINKPSFSLRHEMWGTRDMAAFLSIPAALKFREEFEWDIRSAAARKVVHRYRDIFAHQYERDVICDTSWLAQMGSVFLPQEIDLRKLWNYLWETHRIEAMITRWQKEPILRLGFNAYNQESELDDLLLATETFLSR